jgi:hypothetical protein
MCSFNDQQIFIISHGESETVSHSRWAPVVVEARIEPSTFGPVSERFTNLAIQPAVMMRIHFTCDSTLQPGLENGEPGL